MSSLIVQMSSWECFLCNENTLETFVLKKQGREIMEAMGYTAQAHYDIGALKREVLEGIPMERTPFIPKRTRYTTKEITTPISPEEKIEAAAKAKAEREAAISAQKRKSEEEKAAKKQAAEEAKAAKRQAAEEAKAAKRQAAEEAKAAKRQAAAEAKAARKQAAAEARVAKPKDI